MAKWTCPIEGCDVWVGAPSVRPVHKAALNPFFQGKDPHCPTHFVDLRYEPDPVPPDPAKVAKHPGYTLNKELLTSYSIKDQPELRKDLSKLMGIPDKGHKTHGKNFTSAQTMKQVIDNLFATTQGTMRDSAAEAVIRALGYDPRTMMMTK
ncbi:hypothetical protein [Elioraea sp.]|uniref:hypothetical protein n=1 Tax=Elioraea sp. TaxID=2185103 RepID=UPI0025C16205|nr:hypothetical protein [Elioraea sp.]